MAASLDELKIDRSRDGRPRGHGLPYAWEPWLAQIWCADSVGWLPAGSAGNDDG